MRLKDLGDDVLAHTFKLLMQRVDMEPHYRALPVLKQQKKPLSSAGIMCIRLDKLLSVEYFFTRDRWLHAGLIPAGIAIGKKSVGDAAVYAIVHSYTEPETTKGGVTPWYRKQAPNLPK
jgi:hypothetical protein